MTRNTKVAIGSIAALVGLSGCISTESEVLDAAEGCDEYKSGDLGSLDLDPSAKSFIEASIDLKGSTDRISEDVFTACTGIATDLGGENSWKDEEGLSDKISNDRGTGACDVATDLINEELTSAAEVNANVRVAVAEGECPIDFQAQTECDQQCAANTECSPGSVETRCEPGKIIASCGGSCEREAYCVGRAEVSANCMGKCEAKCTGMCAGTCYHEDGSVTEDDANCTGMCAGTCEGECFGRCKVEADAGIECGSEVRCQGSCSGEITEPACVTEYDPPECKVDTACYEACVTRLASQVECTPTTVEVIADVDAEPSLDKLVATLEANLPVIIDSAEAEGKLIEQASVRMSEAGKMLSDDLADISGKSLACVGAAASDLAGSVDTISVTVEASLNVETMVQVD